MLNILQPKRIHKASNGISREAWRPPSIQRANGSKVSKKLLCGQRRIDQTLYLYFKETDQPHSDIARPLNTQKLALTHQHFLPSHRPPILRRRGPCTPLSGNTNTPSAPTPGSPSVCRLKMHSGSGPVRIFSLL